MTVRKQPRTIKEYVKDQRRADCKACKLPEEIRMQINAARRTRVTMPVIVEWLRREHGIVVTIEQFRVHYGATHEGRAGTLHP